MGIERPKAKYLLTYSDKMKPSNKGPEKSRYLSWDGEVKPIKRHTSEESMTFSLLSITLLQNGLASRQLQREARQ